MVEDDRFRRNEFHEFLTDKDLPLTRDGEGYMDPWSDIAWQSWLRCETTRPVFLAAPQQSGEYITQIRDLRSATGCTLKAAKEAIDASNSDYAAALAMIQAAPGAEGDGPHEDAADTAVAVSDHVDGESHGQQQDPQDFQPDHSHANYAQDQFPQDEEVVMPDTQAVVHPASQEAAGDQQGDNAYPAYQEQEFQNDAAVQHAHDMTPTFEEFRETQPVAPPAHHHPGRRDDYR